MEIAPTPWIQGAALTLGVAALVFALVCLLTSRLRFERRAEEAKAREGEGTLSSAELEMLISARIGRRRGDEVFCVALAGGGRDQATLVRLRTTLRKTLRLGDEVAVCDGRELAIVLDASPEAAGVVLRRLQASGASAGDGAGMATGWATYPRDGGRAAELVAAARHALASATATPGGLCPEPPATRSGTAAGEEDLVDPETGVLRADLTPVMAGRFVERNARARRPVVAVRFASTGGPSRAVADLLLAGLRHDDLIGRDEDGFLAVLNADAAGAARAAERLTGAARARAEPLDLRAGMAAAPAHGRTAGELIAAARIVCGRADAGAAVLFDPHLDGPVLRARQGASAA